MNIFYIIGVVVVIIVVAGFWVCEYRESCKPCALAVPSGRDTGAWHRAFGFSLDLKTSLRWPFGFRRGRPRRSPRGRPCEIRAARA
jgi:hypothetical protein